VCVACTIITSDDKNKTIQCWDHFVESSKVHAHPFITPKEADSVPPAQHSKWSDQERARHVRQGAARARGVGMKTDVIPQIPLNAPSSLPHQHQHSPSHSLNFLMATTSLVC
jgi:hypothetical protein